MEIQRQKKQFSFQIGVYNIKTTKWLKNMWSSVKIMCKKKERRRKAVEKMFYSLEMANITRQEK